MATSKKHIRNCRFCQNQYRYCSACDDYKHLPPFMLTYCSENCKDIDMIISNWSAQVIDTKTAVELLKGKDTSRKEFWRESFRNAYNQIMSEADAVPKEAPADPEPVAEPAPSAEEAPAKPVAEPKTADGLKKNVKSQHKVIGGKKN